MLLDSSKQFERKRRNVRYLLIWRPEVLESERSNRLSDPRHGETHRPGPLVFELAPFGLSGSNLRPSQVRNSIPCKMTGRLRVGSIGVSPRTAPLGWSALAAPVPPWCNRLDRFFIFFFIFRGHRGGPEAWAGSWTSTNRFQPWANPHDVKGCTALKRSHSGALVLLANRGRVDS